MYRMAAPAGTQIQLGSGSSGQAHVNSSTNLMMPLTALPSGVMPRIGISGGVGLELQGGHSGHMPLGNMLLQQGTQQLSGVGLGLAGEGHLGMLAALNAYTRNLNPDHQHVNSGHQQQGDSGDDHTSSQ
eukprot:TRINITY_DN8580_c0_g1_i1.p1 TRINITY_DN8580_c0_g1~~TRINITY_DN8580_c0_g1_i1.p1  ORF type:complete len:148 (+),score=13.01 TRINITY_DN8580_c0_g1_i1:59-445(+)